MFPINLRLDGRKVLLVGAGRVGRRKLEKLIKAGAEVLVVEPEPDDVLQKMASDGVIALVPEFYEDLLTGTSLVFAASSDHGLNQAVAASAKMRGLWVNAADSPDLSDFILPAVVESGGFQVSISTGGASPALAAAAAAELREQFGPVYGRLVRLTDSLRPVIMAAEADFEAREKIFKRLINSAELRERLAEDDAEAVRRLVKKLITPVKLTDDAIIF